MPATDLFARVVGIVFPVFLIVAIGWMYGRRHQPDMVAANRMNMEVFLPALVLGAIADRGFDIRDHWQAALAMTIMILGSGIIAYLIARLAKIDPLTLVPPMMFNNVGNLGIPLALLAFGNRVLPVVVIVFVTSNLWHFSLGAYLLNRQQQFRTLWRIPVVLAALLGLALTSLHLEIWPPLLTAIHLAGEISVPLMLFALGVKVAEAPLKHLRLGLGAGLLRPVMGLALMGFCILLLQIRGETAGILLLFGSLPPAVLNYMFAERYNQEPERVASIVLAGNLIAVLILPLVLGLVLSTQA